MAATTGEKTMGKSNATTPETTMPETTPEDKAMNQRDANKAAAGVAFKVLYNEGKEWPSALYDDKTDEEKVLMHQGYMNTLMKLAKLAGIKSSKTVAFEV